eukprot:scaffold10301_cov115-Skeletonema_dohrnii-CCMP3373.AAC.4
MSSFRTDFPTAHHQRVCKDISAARHARPPAEVLPPKYLLIPTWTPKSDGGQKQKYEFLR